MSLLSQHVNFLQVSNGLLLVVLISMIMIFGHYVYQRWKEWRRFNYSFYSEVKPALAMFVFIFGEGVIRAVIWLAQFEQIPWGGGGRNGELLILTLLGGVATAAVGGLCVIRAFSPLRWRWLVWSATAVATIIFSAVTWPH